MPSSIKSDRKSEVADKKDRKAKKQKFRRSSLQISSDEISSAEEAFQHAIRVNEEQGFVFSDPAERSRASYLRYWDGTAAYANPNRPALKLLFVLILCLQTASSVYILWNDLEDTGTFSTFICCELMIFATVIVLAWVSVCYQFNVNVLFYYMVLSFSVAVFFLVSWGWVQHLESVDFGDKTDDFFSKFCKFKFMPRLANGLTHAAGFFTAQAMYHDHQRVVRRYFLEVYQLPQHNRKNDVRKAED